MYVRVSEGVKGDNDEWAAHRKDMLDLTTTKAHLALVDLVVLWTSYSMP